MATPAPLRRPRGNPGWTGRAPHLREAEEEVVEAGALLRDMVALEVEEGWVQRDLREAEEHSARLRASNLSVEHEAHRHLSALVDGLRALCVALPQPSPERTACWVLIREAQQVVELEARARDFRRRVEEREAESRQHRARLADLTAQEIALGRSAVAQLREVGRSVISIDARGANVTARDISIGGGL